MLFLAAAAMDEGTAVLPQASSTLETSHLAQVILNLLCISTFVMCGALQSLELTAGAPLPKSSVRFCLPEIVLN